MRPPAGVALLLGVLQGPWVRAGVLLREWGFNSSWREMDSFLQLPEVRSLTMSQKKTLARLLGQGAADDFEVAFKDVLAESQGDARVAQEELDRHAANVAGDPDWDFATLVSEVFNKRPKPASTKDLLREMGEVDFQGRVIHAFGTDFDVVGIVQTCTKPASPGSEYTLSVMTEAHNQPIVVRIQEDFSGVSVTSLQPRRGFAQALCAGLLRQDQQFTLDHCPPAVCQQGVVGATFKVTHASPPFVILNGPNGAHLHVHLGPQEAPGAIALVGEFVAARLWTPANNSTQSRQNRETQPLSELCADDGLQVVIHSSVNEGWVAPMTSCNAWFQGKPTWVGSLGELDKQLWLFPQVTLQLEGLSSANFDDWVFLHGADDASERRILQNRLREAQHELRLVLKKNSTIHNSLIQSFALGQPIPDEAWACVGPFLTPVEEMSRKLKQPQGRQRLLAQAVEEALYETIVNCRDLSGDASQSPAVVQSILQMVQFAEAQVEKMQGKKAVFLVGDTGSGKSTTASYLLRLNLTEVDGGFMGKAFTHNVSEGPKISTAWFVSETLYATGYELERTGHIVVDCPGFEDTRGPGHGLVTGVSLDRAVRATSSISAVVLTVPYSTFTEARGVALLDLLDRLRARFPRIVDPSQFDDGDDQGLHVLVTKGSKCRSGEKEPIENGRFFREALHQCQKVLSQITATGLSKDVQQRKCDTWQSLQNLAVRQRVRFVQLKNKQLRKDLVAEYTRADRKPKYATSFEDPRMQKDFADAVARHAHAWHHQILGRYVDGLPREIRRLEVQVNSTMRDIADSHKLVKDRAASLQLTLHSADKRIAELKRLLEGSTDDELLAKLAEWNSEDNRRVEQAAGNLSHSTEAMNEAAMRLKKARSDLGLVGERIAALRQKKESWGQGFTDDVLYEQHHNVVFKCCHIDGRARDKALLEVTSIPASAIGECWDVDPQTFTGGTIHQVYIPKQYRVVLADGGGNREQFRKDHSDRLVLGDMVATISGTKYELLERNAHVDGKSVVYRVGYTFDGLSPFPSARVVHRIPNIEYNSAKILNGEADVVTAEKERANAQGLLRFAVDDHRAARRRQKEANELLDSAMQQARSQVKRGAEERLASEKRHWEDLGKQQKAQQEEEAREERHRAKLHGRLEDLRKRIERLKRDKMHLAFLIQRQHGSADVLLKLVKYLEDILKAGSVNPVVFEELSGFREGYDPDRLKESTRADLASSDTRFLGVEGDLCGIE